ncbi:hypothetical protein D7X74_31020 [Corallococcus sp. CA047B]|uniref:hypothetical protein n=1 Tax=Corallococcus sp. CA047B TaxID=2316729 RepID=UPI000EA06609|nr:hypothetical protein [Corallococcus sp. CA047B]RKH08721.1 hypothetical protein D7X74_31020 [Corallococcus sp. CA047B]
MSTPNPTPYTPPADIITAAESALATARPDELGRATVLYTTYCGVTGGRSAVTGAELPPFEKCPLLVRAAWLAVALAINTPVASVVPPGPVGAPVVPPGQKPSVGRAVHYQDDATVCAADITAVNPDGTVDLLVKPPRLLPWAASNVSEALTGAPLDNHWNWMPRV